MARSRYLPDPSVLERLLAGAGLKGGRTIEQTPAEGDWVRFDERPVTTPPAPLPRPAVTPPKPPVPALARHEPAPISDFRIQEIRDVKPRPAEAQLAEPDDEQLAEMVFGSAAAGLGVELRLQKLTAWLVGSVGGSSAFVADLEGLPLSNRNTPEAYIVAIAPLARAQAEIARFVPQSPPGTSVVELGPQSVLEVVWSDTPTGRIGVGVVVSEPLKPNIVSRIRRVAALSVVSRGDL